MNDKSVKDGSYEDYLKGKEYYSDKVFTFQLASPDLSKSYKKDVNEITGEGTPVYFPAFESFPTTGEFIRTSKGKEEIRYVPGQKTIFVSEMTANGKEDKTNYRVKFDKGYKQVEGYDHVLVEYMMNTSYNFSNPKRELGENAKNRGFILVDRSAGFKKELENDRKSTEAKAWCNDAEGWAILDYALPLFGESFLNGKSIEELRWHLKQVALRDPAKFLNDRDSDYIKKKSVILKALDKGIIALSTQRDRLSWASNPAHPFITSPIGIDAIDQFVENTLTPDGERVYAEIVRLLTPKGVSKVTYVAPPEPMSNASKDSMNDIEKLIEELVAGNILTITGRNWLNYKEGKWNGKAALATELKSNPELLETLKEELVKA